MNKKRMVFANNPLLGGPAMDDRARVGIPYRELPIGSIDTDPNQPRVMFDSDKLDELSRSIQTYGVLSPILVRPGGKPGRYMLISGERRIRAAKMAGLKSIPAMVSQEEGASDDKTLAIQLVENIQRADLSPLERAHAIAALKDTHSLSVRDIGDKLGISKSMVQRSLDILNLPDDLLHALREGASESKVLLLAKIEDPEIRASYLKDLDVLTRSKLQKDLDSKGPKAVKESAEPSPEDSRIADEIRRALGVKVALTRAVPGAEKGRLVIEFYSDGDLQDIFRRLVGDA